MLDTEEERSSVEFVRLILSFIYDNNIIFNHMDKIVTYLNELNSEVQELMKEEKLLPVPAFTEYGLTGGLSPCDTV